MASSGVSRDALPQKRILGNRDPAFVLKRRAELETYLQTTFQFLSRSPTPQSLAEFLRLDCYDVNLVLRRLACEAFKATEENEAENVDRAAAASKLESVRWTPLETFAISERLKAADPPQFDDDGGPTDFTNVVDRACRLKRLAMKGDDAELPSTNIVPNSLSFDLVTFKNLTSLTLESIRCSRITSLGSLRNTLKSLTAHMCWLNSISDMLLCDETEEEDNEMPKWTCLEYLDLSDNEISILDSSIGLAPKLKTLRVNHNQITKIENLTPLSDLSELEISENLISETKDLHTKLGQITSIDMSFNRIHSLVGFSRLYSLQHLSLAGNRVEDFDADVRPISQLPCLESLNLQSNRVTSVVDYRLKVFESFGKRCSELTLDNESPSQSEVDKVSVRMALRVAREGRSPTSLFGNLPNRVSST